MPISGTTVSSPGRSCPSGVIPTEVGLADADLDARMLQAAA
ncbi:hypothetical protein [Amycolatopsis sp.]|nr:hypothetical protein [Amycolatopsis sp.]